MGYTYWVPVHQGILFLSNADDSDVYHPKSVSLFGWVVRTLFFPLTRCHSKTRSGWQVCVCVRCVCDGWADSVCVFNVLPVCGGGAGCEGPRERAPPCGGAKNTGSTHEEQESWQRIHRVALQKQTRHHSLQGAHTLTHTLSLSLSFTAPLSSSTLFLQFL